MATWYAQSTANWNAANEWNSAANGSGSFGTPANGDVCDLNGKVVTLNVTLPDLSELKNTASGGQLAFVPSASTSYTWAITTVTGPTAGTTAMIAVTGANTGLSLTINSTTWTPPTVNAPILQVTLTGSTSNAVTVNISTASQYNVGALTGSYPIYCTGTNKAALTVTMYGIRGGTVTNGQGIYVQGTGNFTFNSQGGGVTVNASAIANANGIYLETTGTKQLNSDVTGASGTWGYSNEAVACNTATTPVTITGNIINQLGQAVRGTMRWAPTAGMYVQFLDSTGTAFKVYYPLRHGIARGECQGNP